jgi:hypothetical protein
MYLAYLDESGDAGPAATAPTGYFVVACALVRADDWLDCLDSLKYWRSSLRASCGLSVRSEVKASAGFLRGGGPFKALSLDRPQRMQLYADSLDYVASSMPVTVFAVAVDKVGAASRGWPDPRIPAWTFAFQRIQRFVADQGTRALIFPDEGHDFLLKRVLRKGRRYHQIGGHFGNTLQLPMNRIVEDPNSRQSHESYFIQLADWLAFAAHRSNYIDPKGPFSSGLWDRTAPVQLTAVNQVTGGPPAIVKYPL